MKRYFLFVLAVSLMVVLIVSGCAQPSPAPAPAPSPAPAPAPAPAKLEPVTLDGLTFEPKDSPTNLFTLQYYDRLTEDSDGAITINYAGGPEAIKAFDQVDAVTNGVADIDNLPGGYLVSTAPELLTLTMSRIAAWEERETGLYDLWKDIFAKKFNMYYLGRINYPEQYTLYTNVKLKSSKDIKGLKIRASRTQAVYVESLGASTVTIPPVEIYTAMERGVIDGYVSGWVTIASKGLDEVTKYIIEPPVGNAPLVQVVNMDTWNSLSKGHQDIMNGTFQAMEKELAPYFEQVHVDLVNQVKAKGVEILTLEDGDYYSEQFYVSAEKYLDDNAPGWDKRLRDLGLPEALKK